MAKERIKRLEDADYAALAKYDRQLTTLLRARYLVGVGHTALEWMRDWWKRYTGNAIKVNENCANCVADFLDGVAKVYAKEKEAREADAIAGKVQGIVEKAVEKAFAETEKPKNGKSTARQKAARTKVGNTK